MKKIMKRLLFSMLLVVALTLLMSTVAFAVDTAAGESPPDFLTYVVKEAFVLIPALYIIGMIIKLIHGIPDWTIPFALLIIGVVAAMALIGWTVQGAIQGVLVAGTTVFTNQIYKQAGKAVSGSG